MPNFSLLNGKRVIENAEQQKSGSAKKEQTKAQSAKKSMKKPEKKMKPKKASY